MTPGLLANRKRPPTVRRSKTDWGSARRGEAARVGEKPRDRMIRFIVCSRVAHLSGHRLANQITALQGHKCYYYNRDAILHPEMRHVRYGSRRVTSENCLNRRAAVQRASNKLGALQLFHEHGVPVPPHLQVGGY